MGICMLLTVCLVTILSGFVNQFPRFQASKTGRREVMGVHISSNQQRLVPQPLVFQNAPVIPSNRRCLEPLKAEPQEVCKGVQTPILTRYDWKTREHGSYPGSYPGHPVAIPQFIPREDRCEFGTPDLSLSPQELALGVQTPPQKVFGCIGLVL